MNRRSWAVIVSGGVSVLLILCCLVSIPHSASLVKAEAVIDPSAAYPVMSVTDGDTLKVRASSRDITVRLLGINTPETVDPRKPPECFGHEASDEAKSLMTGRSVRLAFSAAKEHRDKYGRYLMYAYRDDGLFLNEYLLRQGFAREYTVGKAYSLQASFRKAEGEAKAAGLGLWKACDKP